MSKDQKIYDVKIHEVEQVWDKGEGRVTKTNRHPRFNDESVGTDKLIAVYKAIKSIEKTVTDLDMLEVKVNGSPFPG